ncbi:DNA-directed RNA polymerase subunit beta' [Candidatus Saccharibacteria bacterium]|nr:DNA-directed RNA polymerase subunit beta' [Candidatus Saccharibacteria bacterium]
MRRYSTGINISDFDAVRLAVASSDDILDWSHGEVTKPETINYRTQKPERDGLFCERIFGPVKDINPHDAKFKGVRSREAAVDKRGEVVTKSIVRRERMGHISLAAPVAHIWFLRGTPSAIGLLLGMTVKNLERIAYFAAYVVVNIDTEGRDRMLADKEAEFAAAKEAIKARYEGESKEEGANVKELAKMQTKELEELEADFAVVKEQLVGLEKKALMSETEYRNLPDDVADLVTVEMGGSALETLLKDVDLQDLIAKLQEEVEEAKGQRRKKLMKRLRLLESMDRAGIKPTSMCLTILPVIPPDLRPMVQLTGGRFATSDLNDLYRRVINRNNRLKKLIDLNAPEVIKRNEQRMLQEAVDALIDNNSTRSGRAIASTGQRRRLKSLSDMLKGKQGRFRQNLLGKRVDYSGRSVIVAGPELNIDQCGLPKMMALELFKPFVIGWLIECDFAHNIRSATRMIELGETAVWDALDDVIRGKYVLLNRAPSLHRLSIQAFQPVLIEGKAIQLHPLVCKGFNADFDGDQMAVHLPLSDEAQAEAREIMAANRNLLKPADGSPILHVEQDIVLGAYYLTYNRPGVSGQKPRAFSSVGEAIMARDNGFVTNQTPVRVNFRGEVRETTLGRLIFNEIFPEDFTYQTGEMTKKQLQNVLADVYAQYGQEETARIADELKRVGFEFATRSGLSMGMDDFSDLKEVKTILEAGEKKAKEISDQYEQGFITDEERYRLTVENWLKADATVQETLAAQFVKEDSSMSIAVNSGARGNIGQVKTAVGLLGVVTDATGKAIELPIRSNYKGGLTPLEYFTATRGARKGMIDTALKTADSGYLTRRLVDVSQDVFTTDEDIEDPGFALYREGAAYIGVPYGSRLEGRYAAENIGKYVKKGELITSEIASQIDTDESLDGVKIMSVLSVPSIKGIPRKSYGLDPATRDLIAEFAPVGVIAAQSIGEPGTQLTLKTFHSGGVAGEDITTGLPRVEELFEVRTPKGQAYLSEVEGVASVWEEGEQYIVQIAPKELKATEVKLEGQTLRVASGSTVREGEVIAVNEDGSKAIVAPLSGVIDVAEDGKIMVTPGKQGTARYEIPGFKQLTIKDGDMIKVGDRLTNGSINLHDLMKLSGVEATQRYIMNEILSIFAAQGQNIADKHLEIIVRQMFSRVQIDEPGDSEFVTGDIVSKQTVLESNERLAGEGKQLIRFNQLLLGITKASLATDSFLSAASFQDTTRVLIGAATSGKVDKLFGLKENVILGRKIPVGTGVLGDSDNDGFTDVAEALGQPEPEPVAVES